MPKSDLVDSLLASDSGNSHLSRSNWLNWHETRLVLCWVLLKMTDSWKFWVDWVVFSSENPNHSMILWSSGYAETSLLRIIIISSSSLLNKHIVHDILSFGIKLSACSWRGGCWPSPYLLWVPPMEMDGVLLCCVGGDGTALNTAHTDLLCAWVSEKWFTAVKRDHGLAVLSGLMQSTF